MQLNKTERGEDELLSAVPPCVDPGTCSVSLSENKALLEILLRLSSVMTDTIMHEFFHILGGNSFKKLNHSALQKTQEAPFKGALP